MNNFSLLLFLEFWGFLNVLIIIKKFQESGKSKNVFKNKQNLPLNEIFTQIYFKFHK